MERYFEKFPLTNYNGYQVKNVMLRAKILDKIVNKPELFKSFELSDSVRPDNIAFQVYSDQYMSWLVYYANQTVDPYYDWFLGQLDFEKYIDTKYGSIANAQNRVVYWTNNWYEDPNTISVSLYNSLEDLKKYYEPVFVGNTALEYKRKEADWSVNTNEIWEYTIDADLQVAVDAKVTISNSAAAQVANGQVLFANSSYLRIHQVFGESNTATGTVSVGSKTANISSASLVVRNISQAERVYWSPITYYDLEDVKNSSKKFVRLIAPEYSMNAALELQRTMNP